MIRWLGAAGVVLSACGGGAAGTAHDASIDPARDGGDGDRIDVETSIDGSDDTGVPDVGSPDVGPPDVGPPDVASPDVVSPPFREPTGVVPISGGPAGALAAVFIDSTDQAWIAHAAGVAVYGGTSWRDSSAGLTMAIASFHVAPSGELFGSGAPGGWRWESGTWVRRLNPTSCASPLRLTSRNELVLGVCAYYPYYVAWPSRDPATIEIKLFSAGTVGDLATVEGGEIYAISGPDYLGQTMLRLAAGADFRTAANWTTVALPPGVGTRELIDLWSPGPGRLIVVGSRGLALTLDGATWAVEDTGTTDDLRAVWGTETDGVYAVGAAGRIVFRHPTDGWRSLSSGTAANLVAVHGRTGGRVVVVGAAGTLLQVVR